MARQLKYQYQNSMTMLSNRSMAIYIVEDEPTAVNELQEALKHNDSTYVVGCVQIM